jgi:cbb3-type cytochrome oxidase subunit 1
MPRVSYAFFTLAALCGLVGTLWGENMGRTNDHSTFIAHAHLNLVGWVSMAVMGGFYALAARTHPQRLAWVNFWLQVIGAVCLTIAMVYLMAGVDRRFIPLAIVGSAATVLSMAIFLAAVVLSWRNEGRLTD